MDIGTAVALIVSVPGVIALVNLAKSVVDLGKFAALVAFVLGVGINLAAWAAGAAYVGADPFSVAALGAMTGLAASGIHDVTNTRSTTVTVNQAESRYGIDAVIRGAVNRSE